MAGKKVGILRQPTKVEKEGRRFFQSLVHMQFCLRSLAAADAPTPAQLTWRTLLVRPVFCASCFKSLASGLWLMAK